MEYNKYFIICNAICKGISNWSYLINWSKFEVDEWESRSPARAAAAMLAESTDGRFDFKDKEDIIELVLNHSQINRPYLFDSLKEAKESLIRIKTNDLFEDCNYTFKYYIVNFVSSYLKEVIEA